ncbi:tumor necrosis factor receptor superfamily member 16 isoform X2 [Polypterus senegalus]|uniref:tumor necrosis factor receptor superfamily member 16 isoform X2 n=1 Tax=Polypterus senegalus TaxID=55291 RepID=UPI0019632311|nr:tumor necrosis factor receptor superfamily member 16 isoform X2 [Polypterus senegalus]
MRRGINLLLALLGGVAVLAAKDDCPSKQYTRSGECCKQCQPGEGVLEKCGINQTKCTACLDSESFSEIYSHTEACQPCTKCGHLLRMMAPCTESADAICVCDYGYFKDRLSGQCMPCTVCPLGQGVYTECTEDRDTTCEQCPEGTYSDQDSSMDPCLPCAQCDEDDEMMLEPCTSTSDAICREVSPRMTFSTMTDPLFMDSTTGKVTVPTNTVGFSNGVGRAMTPTNIVTTTNPSSSQINATIMDKNLIPIYCSILAAVVVGLVAYIVFKRWNSCKQNKQAANNRTVNQTPSPEGEKLHSDSGISVDSQSLQEQQQTQGQLQVKASSCPYANLPTHKQKELENLLKGSAEDDTDWCNLASLLGYQEGHIDTFRQGEHPVQELLSDWGNKDSATVDALCTALRKINREDIAECLSAEPTATSAV